MINWFKEQIPPILAVVIIVGIFGGMYLIGRYMPALGNDLADMLEGIAIAVVVVFVLFAIISPFIDR